MNAFTFILSTYACVGLLFWLLGLKIHQPLQDASTSKKVGFLFFCLTLWLPALIFYYKTKDNEKPNS